MKILIYGAGPTGSIIAARLLGGGQDVTVLARGQRLADLREHGLMLVDAVSGAREQVPVKTCESLGPEDDFDLALVVMRKNRALEVLPVLGANRRISTVVFLMNNAAGSDALTGALGRERVLIGFPGTAGYREGAVVTGFTGLGKEKVVISLGAPGGGSHPRLAETARVLGSAPGMRVEVRADMEDWLLCHAGVLMTAVAPALYLAGGDHLRMARTRDAVTLAVRAGREALAVLTDLGIKITPRGLTMLNWMPEPLLVPLLQRRLANPLLETAISRHAAADRDEIQHLTDEFLKLAERSRVPTPYINRLYRSFDPAYPLLPPGSARIPLEGRGFWVALGVLAAAATWWGMRKRRER